MESVVLKSNKLIFLYKFLLFPMYDISSVQFSCSVMSDSFQTHGLQHARLPCPSPSPRACSNSRPSSRWCHPTISSSCCPLLLLPSVFPSIRVFSDKSVLRIRWPKYWNFSFSISPYSEYSGLISFRMDWFDLLAVQGTLKSLQHHSSKASVLQCVCDIRHCKKRKCFFKNSALLLVKIACVKLPQKKYEDVAFEKLDICKPQTKGALEQEVKEEKAALEKPVDLEEEKKQSDGEIVEKGRTVMAIYKGDPGQSSLRTVD